MDSGALGVGEIRHNKGVMKGGINNWLSIGLLAN